MFPQFHNPNGSRAEPVVLPEARPAVAKYHEPSAVESSKPLMRRFWPPERCAAVTGRVLLAAIFLLSGLGKIMDWSGTEAQMTTHGMILVPLFLGAALAIEL